MDFSFGVGLGHKSLACVCVCVVVVVALSLTLFLPPFCHPPTRLFWFVFFVGGFQEEEALLSEMDVTGQAFEDMQEQNSRLLQQLREKDDANFKLMSERIKSNQIYKLLREEKEELADQVLTFKTQVSRRALGYKSV